MSITKIALGFLVAIATIIVQPAHAATSMSSIAKRIVRKPVAGIDVIVYPMDVPGVVTLRGSLPAGDIFARGGNIAAATLAGIMLDKGTTRQDKFAIAKQLDDVGASLAFGVGEQTVAIQGKALKRNLPLLIHLMGEQLRTPAFDADEFGKAKLQFQAATRAQIDNTGFRAQERLSRTIFPAGHPNRPDDIDAWLAAIDSATLDEVKAFHKKYYGPAHLTLVFVGDVDARSIQSLIAREFAGWTGGVDVVRDVPRPATMTLPEQKVEMQDKTSVSVLLGQSTGLRYQDADTIPLRIGAAVLGSGFTGRLMSTVRDKEGLTYGIGASLTDDTYVAGTFAINATFAPTLLEKGVEAARRELQKWYSEGITAAELADRKTSFIGSYQVSLADTDGMADAISITLARGKPLSWLDDIAEVVAAVTLEQVNSAIRKHIDPAHMVLVEAGTFAH